MSFDFEPVYLRALSSPPSSQDDDDALPAGLAAAPLPVLPSDSGGDLPAVEPQSESQPLDGHATDEEAEEEQSEGSGQVRKHLVLPPMPELRSVTLTLWLHPLLT